jgi:hypothetical protein
MSGVMLTGTITVRTGMQPDSLKLSSQLVVLKAGVTIYKTI